MKKIKLILLILIIYIFSLFQTNNVIAGPLDLPLAHKDNFKYIGGFRIKG